ncbi:MAG: ATP-binding protein [Candidatus Micrarchaeota archaeon]
MTAISILKDLIREYSEEIDKASIKSRCAMNEAEKTMVLEEVTVLVGVRRSGKTFIMYDLSRKWPGPYLNFEDERLADFESGDFEKLLQIAKEENSKAIYLDEIQNVANWEKFAHRIHRQIKLVVSGSNSSLLAGDYATALTGRTRTVNVYPLNFKEFLHFKDATPNRESFEKYLSLGGFPRVVLTEEKELVKEYFEAIINRDIIARNAPKYPEALRKIAIYLLSNAGKPFTYRSIGSAVNLKHEMTTREYISYMKQAYLLEYLTRYDPSLKKQESFEKKAYGVDHSLAYVGMRLDDDRGRVFENAMLSNLRQQGTIFFARNSGETDFLITDSLKPKWALNVCYELCGEREERELVPLRAWKEKNVRATLVVVYPMAKQPEDIEFRLAHEFLALL